MAEKSKFRYLIAPALPPKGRRLRWFLGRIALLVTVTALALVAVGILFKNDLMFYPVAETWDTPQNYGLKYEELWLKTKDGLAVKAWRAPSASGRGAAAIILQGNSGNMSMMASRMQLMHQLGLTAVSVDYPGYGQSEGRPSEEAAYQAAEALWRQVVADGAAPEDIVIFGYSLGGGVASWLAAEHPPAALILDSTFTRVRDVPSLQLPYLAPLLRLVLNDAFDTKTRLAKDIHCPLLVLHSPGDQVVPYQLGREIFEVYENNTKEMVTGVGDHTEFILNFELYKAGVKRLLDRAGVSDPGGDELQPTQVGP